MFYILEDYNSIEGMVGNVSFHFNIGFKSLRIEVAFFSFRESPKTNSQSKSLCILKVGSDLS